MAGQYALEENIPVTSVQPGWATAAGIELDILRLDQLHPQISGNKWFKLKNHLAHAFSHGYSSVLSFGGPWSNHIHALAAAGKVFNFPTVGVIRGERSNTLSATLQDAERWGMRLHFVSRKDYLIKHTTEFQEALFGELELDSKHVWVVPEGGSGSLGVQGCEDILDAGSIRPESYNQIWLASGTGATAAGVIRSAPDTFVQSVAVLKGASWMRGDISQYLKNSEANWAVETNAHHGGYAKTTRELLSFIEEFEQETGVPLDPVYTGKVVLALREASNAGKTFRDCRVLIIHTGGLQGRRGFV